MAAIRSSSTLLSFVVDVVIFWTLPNAIFSSCGSGRAGEPSTHSQAKLHDDDGEAGEVGRTVGTDAISAEVIHCGGPKDIPPNQKLLFIDC